MTPLMKQYGEIKSQYQDCILFFRMGDFYELFDDDAVIASKVLGLTLTSRNNGAAGATPLCGFPYHAAERYVPKMISAGHKVAICEQVEDPKEAKGIVKRDVIEVITAGTSMSENNLDAKTNNFLVSLAPEKDEKHFAMSVVDITTGLFQVVKGKADDVQNELYRLYPQEILFSLETDKPAFLTELEEQERILVSELPGNYFTAGDNTELLQDHFQLETLDSVGIEEGSASVSAAGAALRYVLDQKKVNLEHLDRIEVGNLGHWMTLDPPTLRNLELLKPLNGEDKHSTLVHVLDHTVTAMGGRLLKHWISHPLIDAPSIQKRLDAVEELFVNPVLMDELKESLAQIYDLERLIGRIGSGRANARDLRALGLSLIRAEEVGMVLDRLESPLFEDVDADFADLGMRGQDLLNQLQEDPPLTVREGKMIRDGASEELDGLNDGIRDAREWLSNLESREKERLGIPSLKVGYNKVFGYFLEVTKVHQDKVPEDFIRKQTLANAERYITPEMKEYETRILSAESTINDLEYRIFCQLRDQVSGWIPALRQAALDLSRVDVLFSLAQSARKNGYTRPVVDESETLDIHEGFHPVIKSANPDMEFINNDVQMSCQDTQIMLITGPNMAGKSTYLRQTGLIVLMAQMGSFVPAASARIGVTDRIFTRVGASDRLARGQSTFMVEMIETANILRHASPKSLILLDEIGRGTSTFDGLSLAWAVVESLHNQESMAGKTLFATHYHELNTLTESLEKVKNYRISVKEKAGKLLFLRKIVEGACDSSYGIHVAEMAGVPEEVIFRAKRILHRLETNRTDPSDEHFVAETKPQQDLFSAPDEGEQIAIDELKSVDLDTLSPIDALNFLHRMKKHLL